ncbi:hypothetical protein B7P43_G17266 [Cryptotermes secundus]|uniref:Uncharacterized protein n=2 Tax=Cryptotermes secundus TaxID=105785 RepID=A0A2J7QFP9_9NEOP|nr:hypothetical protein B7P43_G17266 [Cryptotermes secundus]
MVQPHESASTSVPCKLAHPRLSSSGSVCRICHEDDTSENLISPCECTGTLGLVHRKCLEKWLSASNTTECEICKHQFNTRRYQRSIWQWFQSHRGLGCHQGFYLDVLCLLILTPPCLVSIYLCAMWAAVYMEDRFWEATGLASLCFFLLLTYSLWVAVTVRFHWMVMRRWQGMNQIIRLTDLQRCHPASRGQQRTEVNNNGILEQENTSGSSQVFEMNTPV